jgi:hypothetical protein
MGQKMKDHSRKITSVMFNDTLKKLIFEKNRLFKNHDSWKIDELTEILPKVYIYDLPRKYKPTNELPLLSETYYALYDFFRLYCRTYNPQNAEYFFVPINLIQFQFRNENPEDFVNYLKYFDPAIHNHIIIALGDFSQHSKKNHYGNAYQTTYDWLKNFKLLALESTSDLIPNQDIGIIPYNTLSEKPIFNRNERPYLYSFLGELSHQFLPRTHIRHQIKSLPHKSDVFIGSNVSYDLKIRLRKNYVTKNDYELISRNSIFSLAPAGYGRWTYRFFQAIQWGSIPVLLSDDYVKPFEDTIPYNDFCITIPEMEIQNLDSLLRSFSLQEILRLQNALERNQHHFIHAEFFHKLCNQLNHRCKD